MEGVGMVMEGVSPPTLCQPHHIVHTLTSSECSMVIMTGFSRSSVGHLLVPHCRAVDTIPEPSSVLQNEKFTRKLLTAEPFLKSFSGMYRCPKSVLQPTVELLTHFFLANCLGTVHSHCHIRVTPASLSPQVQYCKLYCPETVLVALAGTFWGASQADQGVDLSQWHSVHFFHQSHLLITSLTAVLCTWNDIAHKINGRSYGDINTFEFNALQYS